VPPLTQNAGDAAATATQHALETQQAAQQQTEQAAQQLTEQAAAQQTQEAAQKQTQIALLTQQAAQGAGPQKQPVNITSEGTVGASSQGDDYPATLAVDGDRSTSWFSTGPDASSHTTTFTWTETKDDTLASVTVIGNSENSNPDFRTGFGFGAVTVEVLDATGSVAWQQTVPLPGSPDPDVTVQPNVVGRSVVLIFSGSESADCGGFSELVVAALR